MSNIRRIAKNTVLEASNFIARSLSIFIIPLLLARFTGAELLGEYATLIALAGICTFISAFGLPSFLIREISRLRNDKEQIARLVNASLGLVVVFSVAAILLMIIIGIILGYSINLLRAIVLTGIALTLESMANVIASSFRGVEEMKWSSGIVFVTEITFLVLTLIVLLLSSTIVWLMTAYLVSRIISFVVGIRFYYSRFGALQIVADRESWRKLLKMSFPFAANEAVSLAHGRLGVLFLSYFSGSIAVGFFDIAIGLTMRMNILARSINQALYPFLSSQFIKDKRSLQSYTVKSIRLLLVPGFLIATMLWAFGREIVQLLYGKEFLEAVDALKLLTLLIPIRFIGHSLAVVLTASNRQEKRSLALTIAALTNVLLNLLFIPTYHLMGAVYASLFTQIVLFGLYIWYLRDDVREMIDWHAFVGPGIGSFIIVFLSFFLKLVNTWVLCALSILLYSLIVTVIDRSLFRQLRMIVGRRMTF